MVFNRSNPRGPFPRDGVAEELHGDPTVGQKWKK